jgi:hypothetical protein
MKNTSEIEEKGYLNAQDVKKILTNVKPALSILTHFGIKAFNSNPILLAREIKKSLESNLISAKDGISVNVLDNLLLEKQKTLDEFKKNQIKNG